MRIASSPTPTARWFTAGQPAAGAVPGSRWGCRASSWRAVVDVADQLVRMLVPDLRETDHRAGVHKDDPADVVEDAQPQGGVVPGDGVLDVVEVAGDGIERADEGARVASQEGADHA